MSDVVLYPPIIKSTFMPAFDSDSVCRVYFSISELNNINDVDLEKLEIIVQDLKTNKNVLKQSGGIDFAYTEYPDNINSRQHCVLIHNSMINGGFKNNNYYKVQLRLIKKGSTVTYGTINTNLQDVSQWSQIALIYRINKPTLEINNLNSSLQVNQIDYAKPIITGKVIFTDSEILNNYRIEIFDKSSGERVEDSGMIYTGDLNNKNLINYKITSNLQRNQIYKLNIFIQTSHAYSFSKQYNIKILSNTIDSLQNAKVNVQPNNIDGFLRVNVDALRTLVHTQEEIDSGAFTYNSEDEILIGKSLYLSFMEVDGEETAQFSQAAYFPNSDRLLLISGEGAYISSDTTFTIRRTSNRTNFKIWEDFTVISVVEENVTKIIFDDYTVQPGTWYKYEIVQTNIENQREVIKGCVISEPQMIYTDDIFLGAEGKQIKISFNPQISNFSIKTSDNIIETLGARYPFVRRSGNLYYKTFSLSGMISQLMDSNNIFFKPNQEDYYSNEEGGAQSLYKQYNKKNNITAFNDFVKEREFREKVLKFLYADNIKLFRSLTEGNLLVKLTNITLTPELTLGRMIYSFSCTVTEIDENEYKEYIKNKVQTLRTQTFINSSGQEQNQSGSSGQIQEI